MLGLNFVLEYYFFCQSIEKNGKEPRVPRVPANSISNKCGRFFKMTKRNFFSARKKIICQGVTRVKTALKAITER